MATRSKRKEEKVKGFEYPLQRNYPIDLKEPPSPAHSPSHISLYSLSLTTSQWCHGLGNNPLLQGSLGAFIHMSKIKIFSESVFCLFVLISMTVKSFLFKISQIYVSQSLCLGHSP